MKKLTIEGVVKKFNNQADELFDFLVKQIKKHDKAFVKGTWLARAELDDSILCSDAWIEWFDKFTKFSYENVSNEGWDFYIELTGELIMFPVFEVYQNSKSIFKEEILTIWNMGEPVTEEELKRDHRKDFKATIPDKLRRWKKYESEWPLQKDEVK